MRARVGHQGIDLRPVEKTVLDPTGEAALGIDLHAGGDGAVGSDERGDWLDHLG